MNFDNENRNGVPRVTGLPESQFRTPEVGSFMAENPKESNDSVFEEVKPFNPEEYTQVREVKNSQSPAENIEEREIVNWQAQDLIIGDKNKSWYIIFSIIILAFCLFAILNQSWTFLALIIVSAIGILTLRKSNHTQIISYSLSTHGVYMGETFHSYGEFRAFGIRKETNAYAIILLPKKRFSPSTIIYFPKENGEKITDIIGARLPMEEVKLDLIDKIIRKINL
ncbi:MAG: hypothetical protein HXL38_000100 [Candidatus Saccharimonas sp.]|nr:hypothetical protein [Candidatus Nanogingivalaceae bacterium]QWB90986.1 MAG: hypothetical protein HXL38_000100 [Candidatus Saccharimonas sp.]